MSVDVAMKRACRTISQWTNSVPKRHASRSFTCGSAHRRSAQQTNSNSRSPIHHQQASVASSTLLRRARTFHTSSTAWHGHLTPPKAGEERKITFIDKEGQSHEFLVGDGDNLLDIAQAHDLEMEGACGGSCACSTCHVIVEDGDMYDKIEEASDDENDMLDLAFGLTETSRLGCQVTMSKALDGLVVRLPAMSRNMQASDFAEREKK